jgi:uncharacterized protein YcbK (DUF882 family)
VTVKQQQCLLEYLGYYSPENSNKANNVDGIFGEKSKAATKAFQTDYGIEANGICDSVTEKALKHAVAYGMPAKKDWWDGIKHFTRDEFKCKCGKHCDGFPVEPEKKLVTVADRVRAHFGKAAIISSGVRCKQHNANVGGVANSRHLSGKAMDFRVSGKSAKEVLAYAEKQPEIRYAYAIDKNYIHMDIE